MTVKKTRNRNKYQFKKDIRSYFKEQDIKDARDIITDSMKTGSKIKASQVKSAQYVLDQCFGQPNEKPALDTDKSKTILMLPPKDADIQEMIDKGRIKPPKNWKKIQPVRLPTVEEIQATPDEEPAPNEG
jgi:hypothetical protein